MTNRALDRRTLTLAAAATAAVAFTGRAGADENESTPMSTDDARQVLMAYLDALVQRGDFGQYLREEVAMAIMDTGEHIEGRDAVVQAITDWHTVAFDATPRVTRVLVDDGAAAAELLFVGTHTGDFAGIAATGMDVSVPYVAFYAFEDGLISEIRLYGIVDGLLRQLSSPVTPQATAMASSGDEYTVQIQLKEFSISADRTTLEAGQEYTLVATNVGMMVHEMVVEPAGSIDEPFEVGDKVSEIEDIEPGSSGELVWTFDQPGAYQFACHIPGHYEMGMVLEFTVA